MDADGHPSAATGREGEEQTGGLAEDAVHGKEEVSFGGCRLGASEPRSLGASEPRSLGASEPRSLGESYWEKLAALVEKLARWRADRYERDDVQQEVATRVVSLGDGHLGRVRNLAGYLRTAVEREVARRRKARKGHENRPVVAMDCALLAGRMSPPAQDPGLRHQRIGELRERLLGGLSRRDREVYYAVFVSGLSPRETAGGLALHLFQVQRSMARIEARARFLRLAWQGVAP